MKLNWGNSSPTNGHGRLELSQCPDPPLSVYLCKSALKHSFVQSGPRLPLPGKFHCRFGILYIFVSFPVSLPWLPPKAVPLQKLHSFPQTRSGASLKLCTYTAPPWACCFLGSRRLPDSSQTVTVSPQDLLEPSPVNCIPVQLLRSC